MNFSKSQINGSQNLLKIFCGLIVTVLTCIAIGHYAFKNGTLTCEHYVLNTYLYIVLAILIMFIMVLANDQFGILNGILNVLYSNVHPFIGFVIFLVIIIGLTWALHSVNPANILTSNLIWLALIIFTGIIMVPIIIYGRMMHVVGLAGLLTVALVLITGLLGYHLGDKIVTFDWDYYLNIGVWVIIFAYFGVFLVHDIRKYMFVLAIISLVMFVLLLLSNHKKLKDDADKCIDGKVVPNYPVESYGLVIKMVNIMSDLIFILKRR